MFNSRIAPCFCIVVAGVRAWSTLVDLSSKAPGSVASVQAVDFFLGV